MRRQPVTHSTLLDLMNNSAGRGVSPSVRDAHGQANGAHSETCSRCERRKMAAQASSQLLDSLRRAPDSEIDRIKRVLGVDALVFSEGMTFIER